jgi:hypothetical protein
MDRGRRFRPAEDDEDAWFPAVDALLARIPTWLRAATVVLTFAAGVAYALASGYSLGEALLAGALAVTALAVLAGMLVVALKTVILLGILALVTALFLLLLGLIQA